MQKLNLSQIEDTYEIILHPEAIVGGSGSPISIAEINSIFNLSGLNAGTQSVFITEVQMLSSTSVGAAMLNSLYNNAIQTGGKISVTNLPPDPGAAADYYQSSNSINLGDLTGIDTTNNNQNAIIFGTISHELYHAYESQAGIVENGNKSSTEITVELDAYLFQGMAEKELDSGSGTSYYVHDIGKDIADPKTQSQAGFVAAWNSVMSGQGFNVAGYNNMINEMKNTWFDIYGNESTDNVTFLNSTVGTNQIYNMYTNVYNNASYVAPSYPGPGGSVGAGSGGTGSTGSPGNGGGTTSPPTGSYTSGGSSSSGGTTPPTTPTTPGGNLNNSGDVEWFWNEQTQSYEEVAPGSPEPGPGWIQVPDPRSY